MASAEEFIGYSNLSDLSMTLLEFGRLKEYIYLFIFMLFGHPIRYFE